MKKIIVLIFAVSMVLACKSPPPPPPADMENPNTVPEIAVTIPELFSPDPDVVDDTMTIGIAITHPVPIKNWAIEINRRVGGQTGQARQATQSTGRASRNERNRRRGFFELTGTGTPPAEWKWNGKGTSGEMVQSATDYTFTLSVNDVFDNNAVYEGVISVDVLVIRDGDALRMIVPSIVFPANSADLTRVTEEETRVNTRVLRLIANALNKFADYKVLVEGHANPTTPAGAKRDAEEKGSAKELGLQPLSESRAKAVVDYLVANNGIDKERLSSVGMGGTRTVADYKDEEENWKNRRVEFILNK
ncbi:MAG: OmpA family protein [Treponema sp.]|jgi:outer membrane protein OmpA-like peptidoglycan-associated protein|nr:OmpA family protein [Treponema sp.]